jgi:hypothetical protein
VQGKAVLVHTGWAKRWGLADYFRSGPFLTASACEYLVKAGATLAGIDCANIDNMNDPAPRILCCWRQGFRSSNTCVVWNRYQVACSGFLRHRLRFAAGPRFLCVRLQSVSEEQELSMSTPMKREREASIVQPDVQRSRNEFPDDRLPTTFCLPFLKLSAS